MNEVIIVDHSGDNLDDLMETAKQIVAIKTVSYVVFTFNGIKMFYLKDSKPEDIIAEYQRKLKNVANNFS